MLFLLNYRGEIAALSAALIWAIASLIYVGLGKQMPPLLLNFAKNGVAIALILLTLLVQGNFAPQIGGLNLGLLLLSGVIGIGFGDTAFLEALNCLGARRSLLVESLAPPLAAVLASVFLAELLSVQAWIGILLTVAGVAWVVVERTPDQVQHIRPLRGIGFGLLAAFGQASGAVLSRAALADNNVSPLWSTLIRLAAGMMVLSVLIFSRRQTWLGFQPMRSPRFLRTLVGTAFVGTYLAIWLQQTALKYTAAGIAQALTATSPLFIIPLAMALGERASLRSVAGVLMALFGVWLLLDFG
ncbi:MAG: DMT family transporter [Oscillatoriophycideae cyanobacterium NC_groundwater_1537_Pr4_S-0.65um_50_18]|nr:DMT family transporter [Oscillatoriophycideae cyanobacterium NC_groundwater_1537_Pr4_S-0.65um_50_18]